MTKQEAADYIRSKAQLLKNEDLDTLYEDCENKDRPTVTELFLDMNINPLAYMAHVPMDFAYSLDIKEIDIPNGILYIEDSAFDDCVKLTRVSISDSVEGIGDDAFNGCSSLTSIIIPDSVTWIGVGAFAHCTNLTSITLPESLTEISDFAFKECSKLKSIVIPEGVEYIGWDAFEDCIELTNVAIPDSVTNIESRAFWGCKNLQITYAGTKQQWKNLVAGKNIFEGNTYSCNCSDGVLKNSR